MAKKTNSRISSVSYEAIKAEAAELDIEPGIYLNATGSAEKAPYLLRVIPKDKLDLDRFCLAVTAKTGHTFEETRRENDIRMEVIAAAAAEGYTYIDTGYITFDLRIGGSITSTTDQPTAAANPVYLAAYPSRELAASLAAIPAKLSKAAAPFRIDTVWGEDSHDRFVTGGKAFQINATGLDGDEEPIVELVFSDNTRERAEVKNWKPSYIRAIAPRGIDVKTVTIDVTSKEATLSKENVPFKFASPSSKPRIVSMIGEMSGKDGVSKGWYDPMTITLENASTEGAKVRRVLYDGKVVDAETGWNMESVKLEVISPTVMKATFEENVTRETFEIWRTKYRPVTEVQLANGTILSTDMSFEEED